MSLYRRQTVLSMERDAEIFADFRFATEHLPREEAAAIAGVSVPTLLRWERRARRRFHQETRLRLLRHLAREAPERET